MTLGAIVAERVLYLFEFAEANIPLLFERLKKMAASQFLHVAKLSVCRLGSLVKMMSDLIYCQPESTKNHQSFSNLISETNL